MKIDENIILYFTFLDGGQCQMALHSIEMDQHRARGYGGNIVDQQCCIINSTDM